MVKWWCASNSQWMGVHVAHTLIGSLGFAANRKAFRSPSEILPEIHRKSTLFCNDFEGDPKPYFHPGLSSAPSQCLSIRPWRKMDCFLGKKKLQETWFLPPVNAALNSMNHHLPIPALSEQPIRSRRKSTGFTPILMAKGPKAGRFCGHSPYECQIWVMRVKQCHKPPFGNGKHNTDLWWWLDLPTWLGSITYVLQHIITPLYNPC